MYSLVPINQLSAQRPLRHFREISIIPSLARGKEFILNFTHLPCSAGRALKMAQEELSHYENLGSLDLVAQCFLLLFFL